MGLPPDFGSGDELPKDKRGVRILGIDPGTLHTGWGVVESKKGSLCEIAHGAIGSSGVQRQENRLRRIYHGLKEMISLYEPQAVSLEKVFFARNAQSALKLGQARGVALLAAVESGVAVHEYSSTEIKMAVVGYGRASKLQVQDMVASLLHLSSRISADAADALAAAICHCHQGSYHERVTAALSPGGRGRRRWGTT